MNEATTNKSFVAEVQRLLAGGQIGRALEQLRARQAGNKDPEIPLHIALALRMQGDFAGALQALDAALALDPYHLLALLSKGAVLEMMGRSKLAARAYSNALKIAPPDDRLMPSLRDIVDRARRSVMSNSTSMAEHLRAAVDPLRRQFAPGDMARFDECLDIFAGLKKRYVHEPLLLDFPQLPAITFFDRAQFPWLPELEQATEIIRDEALSLVRDDWEKFRPYIQFAPGAPLNQWATLNYSPSWSSLHLWRDGSRVPDAFARCPRTIEVLDKLPLARQEGFAPNAMFSVLAPHTQIPPHTGSTNTRPIVHLPLVVPSGCRFRVGNQTREWKMGEAWVFDDTIEHEAWNDSDEVRVILIFDVWNPFLSDCERQLLTAMMSAARVFSAT